MSGHINPGPNPTLAYILRGHLERQLILWETQSEGPQFPLCKIRSPLTASQCIWETEERWWPQSSEVAPKHLTHMRPLLPPPQIVT